MLKVWQKGDDGDFVGVGCGEEETHKNAVSDQSIT